MTSDRPGPAPVPSAPPSAAAGEPSQPLARLAALYPALSAASDDALVRSLLTEVQVARLPAGALLFTEGAPCRGFPMVLSGEVRVARGTPEGRSLELYRVQPGEVCVVSTSCLFGRRSLVAHGETVAPTELALLSPAGFEQCLSVAPFRQHVFAVFAARLADLMALVDAVAFQRLDQRLAALLLTRGSQLLTTHQTLADELGTVREIVSRLLQRFARAGWVTLGRERITVADPAALQALVDGDARLPR